MMAPILFIACIAGIFSSGRPALATPGAGSTVNILVRALFDEMDAKTHFGLHKAEIRTKGFSDVYVLTVTIAPGGHTGWHTHPGPSVVSVRSGTATYYSGDDPGCAARTYSAGSGFVDPGGGDVHMVRNEGSVDLELVGFQILPAGAPQRIDAPSPGNCAF
jgi:quercetin dioxygenase-like cupin family protein